MLLEADLTQACAALRELYDADLCSCLLLDAPSDELVVVAAAGPRAAAVRRRRIPAWLGVIGEAFQTGLPVAVPDVNADDRFARGVAVGAGYLPRSMLVAPLDPHGRGTLGVLGLFDPGQATAPALDVPLLVIAAEYVAQRVQSASADAPLDAWLHQARDTVLA